MLRDSVVVTETIEHKYLQRNFYAAVLNQKWVIDVTEFKIPEKMNKQI